MHYCVHAINKSYCYYYYFIHQFIQQKAGTTS